MKETRFYNLLFTVLAMILAFINLFNKKTLGIPSVDYLVYGAICLLGMMAAIRYRRFLVPRNYLVIMLLMAAFIAVNAVVSKYSPSPKYVLMGTAITFMPFLLFVVSYNFRMNDEEIHRYIRCFLAVMLFFTFLVYADSFVLHTADTMFQGGVLSSGIVFFGNYSSLCNQALVLTMAEHYRTRNRRWLILAAFLIVTIILTNQLKAILGMMLVLTGYVFYLTSAKRWVKMTISSLGLAAIIVILSVSASFMLKFENYLDSNTDEDAYAKIARPALYYRAFEMAADFFPFGTGQGTYGSVPVNIVGSRVYSDYELDKIWGLGDDTDFSFKMDAHWASILGEMGYIGAILYLLLFFYPALKISRKMEGEDEKTRRYYIYIIRMGILTLFAEAIVLALPKSFSFMIIYAGLAGLIMNRTNEVSNELP
ncbi:MAG: O-antigen ligase family protein [Bacteroidales bacterium]|nr:O-antigen ligase family protein [Bacteroidales bacterium]